VKLFALLLLAAAPAMSPAPSPSPVSSPDNLPKEALKPIDIDADVFQVDSKQKTGVFKGNVVARQGDVTIRAQQVEASYSKTANAIVKAVAEGGVTVTSGAKVGKADRAEFNNDQRTVVLSGEPRLWEEGSVLEGKQIVFHVDDGRVECFECSIDVDPTRIQQMQEDVNRTKGQNAP
jgi:lipopolysaccharide export system protein LptA